MIYEDDAHKFSKPLCSTLKTNVVNGNNFKLPDVIKNLTLLLKTLSSFFISFLFSSSERIKVDIFIL